MFPFTMVPFGVPIFDPQPYIYIYIYVCFQDQELASLKGTAKSPGLVRGSSVQLASLSLRVSPRTNLIGMPVVSINPASY